MSSYHFLFIEQSIERKMTLIELYHSDTCPNCHYVRAQLLEALPRGVKFKEINTSSPDGAARAEEIGILEVPTITIDGEVKNESVFAEVLEDLKASTMFRVAGEPGYHMDKGVTTFDIALKRPAMPEAEEAEEN